MQPGEGSGDDAGGLRQGGEQVQGAPAEADAEKPPTKPSTVASTWMSSKTRQVFQPMARRMPISRVRSKTDMAMVLAMPRMPISKAMQEVPQATA